jgi:hypothetical protein
LDAVDFDQADAGGVIFGAHDRCPVFLNESSQNSWLAIVARRKSSRLNRCLLRIFPIVARTNYISVAIN